MLNIEVKCNNHAVLQFMISVVSTARSLAKPFHSVHHRRDVIKKSCRL